MKLGPIARPLAICLLSLVVLVLVMSGRAVLASRAAWQGAAQSLSDGDVDTAIVQLRSAARWYAPLNVYATRSLLRLEQVATAAEAQGEHERALRAYRAIHAAILATRSFYTPHGEILARADERIATLMAREPAPPIEQGRTPEQRKADYLALLAVHDPKAGGVLLAFAGFATWVGSAMAFLLLGVDGEGRIMRRIAKRSVLCLLAGWIAFAIGLRIA